MLKNQEIIRLIKMIIDQREATIEIEIKTMLELLIKNK